MYIASLGGFVRPFQDDFYYYPPENAKGMSDLLHERFHWTGRFSTTTLHLAIGWAHLHWVVPLVSFVLLGGGLYAFLRVLGKRFAGREVSKAIYLFSALLLTTVIFLVTPSPYSSFFWLSAAPIHLWSYGLVFLYSAYVLHKIFADKPLRFYDYILFFGAPAIIGMLGELAMFSLAAVVFMIVVAAYLQRSKKLLTIVVANAVGLGIAFYALFFSLGAIIRRGAEKAAPFSEVLANAPYVIVKNFYALGTTLMTNRLLIVALLLVSIALGLQFMKPFRDYKKVLLIVGGISIVLFGLLCLNFVGVYSSVRFTVAWSRTQAFSTVVLLTLVFMYGAVIGVWLRSRLGKRLRKTVYSLFTVAALLVIATNPIGYIQQFNDSVTDRAHAFDAREQQISSLKRDGMVCPLLLPTTNLRGTQEDFDLSQDMSHALNEGVRRYYRLPCNIVGTKR